MTADVMSAVFPIWRTPMISIVKKNLSKKTLAIVFYVSAFVGFDQVYAQSTTMMSDFLPTMNMINLQNNVLWRPYQEKSNNSKPNINSSKSAVRPAATNQLSYTPSLARRKQNLAQFVAKSRAVNPEGATQLSQILASTDVISAVGKAMNAVGLRSDNLADAYAVYWSSAWHASVGSLATPTRAQFAKMKTQAGEALAATPGLIGASDEQKQQFAEALLLQAVLIDGSMEGAKGNPTQLKAVAKAVRQGAKAMGLDLDVMTLTDQGFTLAKKIGAVTTEDDAQLASAPFEPADTASPNYALIAAAGGAGLGGMFLLGKAMGKKG